MNTSNTVQELRDKHLEAIFDRLTSNGTESFVSTKVPKAAESCTQVSIQFAIDLLENCYGDDDTTAGQVSDNVKNRIEELKQQLKP